MNLRRRERDTAPSHDGEVPRPGRGRGTQRWRRPVAIGLVAVLSGGALVWGLGRGKDSAGSASTAKATATAKVRRTDLVSRTDVDGALGYAGHYDVGGQLQGTITDLPGEGSVVERGHALYRVDNRPVTLLYGELPAWRRLAQGIEDGPDVRQLEQNLVALGFATEQELTVDDKFTSATATVVRRWQKALDVEQTGAVELGEAVFLPGAVRVSELKAQKGSPAGQGPVLSATSTSRIVSVDLEASKQSLAKVGDKVEVKLPDGRTTTGTIASVGTTAKTTGQGDDAKQVVSVTVTLDDPAATGTLDRAPVRVGIVSDSRKGVLAVPVNALLALAEGGYGVRVVDAGGSRIVAVKAGLFAKGMVEVEGDGLAEGMDVEVPAA
ncbi:MAG TPA: efflux RND transporter periplasmic adaptor subunit [Acidimicrobiales bacterium]|nr:efflux RND transporter periplasmic adaptor subunit [Acidimicrobiales bacterium]